MCFSWSLARFLPSAVLVRICPLDLTEDDCRMLIRVLHQTITPDRKPLLPQIERLRVILDKLEFAVSD
jgi:hypothetical protein